MTDFQQVIHTYQTIQTLPPKDKFKKLKELAFQLPADDTLNVEQLNLCVTIIEAAKKIAGFPAALNKKLKLYHTLKLKQLGVDLALLKVLLKKNATITVETGLLTLSDKHHAVSLDNLEEQVATGACFAVETGGDGPFSVQVRLVNLEHPLFSAADDKKIIANTEVFLLDLQSGVLRVGDGRENQLEVTLEAGHYRVTGNLAQPHVFIFCLARLHEPVESMKNAASIMRLEP